MSSLIRYPFLTPGTHEQQVESRYVHGQRDHSHGSFLPPLVESIRARTYHGRCFLSLWPAHGEETVMNNDTALPPACVRFVMILKLLP